MPRKLSPKRELRQKENALVLFGSKGKMETPEQRENAALVLKLSEDPRIKALANVVLNPEFRMHSFVWCMDYLGVPLSLVCHEYKELQRSHGYILAAQHLPVIMDTLAYESTNREEICKNCQGEKFVPCYDYELIDKAKRVAEENEKMHRESSPETMRMAEGKMACPVCHAKGVVLLSADMEKLKLTLEAFDITGKSRTGPLVNVDMRKIARDENLEDLAQSIGPLLNGEVK